MVLFFHDETIVSLRRTQDRPFRDSRYAEQLLAWQSQLRLHHRPLAFNSCAVVGSSGNLLVGRPRGALIDGHDAVFRVNYSPTRGYDEYVGRRTTVWVLAWGANTSANERILKRRKTQATVRTPRRNSSSSSSSNSSSSNDSSDSSSVATAPPLTIVHCQPSAHLGACWWHIGSRVDAFANASRLSPLAWQDLRAEIRQASGRTTIGTFPSTGALAVHVALQLCRQVSIFGFGNSSLLGSGCERVDETHEQGSPCDRYYALGPGVGLEQCVRDGARPCPREPARDYERCSQWREFRGTIAQYARGAIWGSTHDFRAEWTWLERLVTSGQLRAPCAGAEG